MAGVGSLNHGGLVWVQAFRMTFLSAMIKGSFPNVLFII